jgi:hypothetical protein
MPHIFNTLPQSLFFSQVVQTMGSIAVLRNGIDDISSFSDP